MARNISSVHNVLQLDFLIHIMVIIPDQYIAIYHMFLNP